MSQHDAPKEQEKIALAKIETVKKTQAQIDAEKRQELDTEHEKKRFKLNDQAEKLRLAWQNRASVGDGRAVENHTDFLPAALEIQQTPPNRVAVYTGRLLIALFIIAVFWACIGKVNVVAVAEGKIIPSSRIKQIQPLEKGVVRQVFVKEGQSVKKGEKLVELDRTFTAADMARLRYSVTSVQLDIARLTRFIALLQGNTHQIQMDEALVREYNVQQAQYQSVIATQNHVLMQQWQQYQAQVGSLASNRNAKQAELETTEAHIEKLTQTLPIVAKRAQKYKGLVKQKMVAEDTYLEVEQERIEKQQDLSAQHAHKRQLIAELNQISKQQAALKAETLGQSYQDLSDADEQEESLTQELNKATDLNAKQILYAPVTGRVQELQVNTIGGVVTEAQNLMTIVPKDQVLEVQAFLENKDIGFVEEGMAAEIKVHTFPFTKYGIIDANVTSITTDALANQENGLFFAMHLTMKKNTIFVNGKDIPLHPGMQVSAEVTTGKRRIIEYILTPLLKGFKESVRER